MKKILPVLLLIGVSVLLIHCGKPRPETEIPGALDKKFSTYAYTKADSNLVVIVDYEMALHRKTENYFPLSIKVANKNLSSLTVDRDSLILEDMAGEVYFMPTINELQSNYDKLTPDGKFKSRTGLLADSLTTSFSFYRKAESNFFPQTPGAGRIIDTVFIQYKGYMEDFIYFPMPLEGIENRVFILRIEAPELDLPFEIRFMIK